MIELKINDIENKLSALRAFFVQNILCGQNNEQRPNHLFILATKRKLATNENNDDVYYFGYI
ncbi:hypothetical protein DERF_008945 [Dermatophagoides farinae]|uniref:Uncharacterized protein n=1 Tax=Dermatophagoides farinae TaxID=6954 RepID=A0A922L0Y6_DERFA|nr:hypothetical protein DERF_008945 [Dermatophagoides farinae]